MSTAAHPDNAAVHVLNGATAHIGETSHISQRVRALAGARYVSLTTYRHDGTPVATPVRTAIDGAPTAARQRALSR